MTLACEVRGWYNPVLPSREDRLMRPRLEGKAQAKDLLYVRAMAGEMLLQLHIVMMKARCRIKRYVERGPWSAAC